MWSVRASFFDHLVTERDAFRIVLLEPLLGKLWRREYLEVVDVANLLVRIDVNPNGRHSPLLGFNHANAFDLPRGGYAVPHDRTRCQDPGNQSIRRTFRT